MRTIHLTLAVVLALAVVALTAGCATALPPAPTVSGQLPLSAAPVPAGYTATWPSLYPTPQRADYLDRLLPLEGARIVDENSAEFDAVLSRAGLDEGWPRLPFEGYVLVVTSDAESTVIVTAGRDELGRRWAQTALEQMTVELPGGRFVRECRVLDWPAFLWRGSKRPMTWERAYRANFAWGTRDGDDHAGRTVVSFVAPGNPLDASDEAVAGVLERFAEQHAAGVRHFAVKFDDVGFGLTPDSELAFGSYPRALVEFLRRINDGLPAVDPNAILYFLPQTYWWNDPRLPSYADALRASGGLPKDIGLVLTGPEVISETIDPEGLYAARGAFGALHTPALIYDNLGRETDWGPLTGRGARLSEQAAAVFGERGTPVNRLTRLDWSWNPEGYDPERSFERAVLELAGPDSYAELIAVCRAFRAGAAPGTCSDAVDAFAATRRAAPAPGGLSRGALVDLLRADVERLSRGAVRKPERRSP